MIKLVSWCEHTDISINFIKIVIQLQGRYLNLVFFSLNL